MPPFIELTAPALGAAAGLLIEPAAGISTAGAPPNAVPRLFDEHATNNPAPTKTQPARVPLFNMVHPA
jgi:hypothetical protein